jgi:hypothetical protein
MPESSRRLRRLFVSKELLPDLLRGGSAFFVRALAGKPAQASIRIVTCALPSDFQIVHAMWNSILDGLDIICRSESFDELPLGFTDVPQCDVIFRQEYLSAAEVAARLKQLEAATHA